MPLQSRRRRLVGFLLFAHLLDDNPLTGRRSDIDSEVEQLMVAVDISSRERVKRETEGCAKPSTNYFSV